MKKIFILGVGAQKAGTTWLHRQLIKSANFNFGHRKEYHVFDSIEKLNDPSREKGNYSILNNCISSIIDSHSNWTLGRNINKGQRRYQAIDLSFLDNIENYFEYFNYLYLKDETVQAVGDITPQYALLKQETFQLIKEGLEKRGFDIKVIFLMRDPAERAWSAAKYRKRNMTTKQLERFDEVKFLRRQISTSGNSNKSRYEDTIRNLENVFDKQNIYYEFYERLFLPESQARLQDFLKLQLFNFDGSKVINSTSKDNLLPSDINEELVTEFQSTYDFLRHRYGKTIVNLWQGYKHDGSVKGTN